MHELSIALSLLDMVSEEAARRGVRVCAIHLRLGLLSGVVETALHAAFEMAREGTELAEARLLTELMPVTFECPQCQAHRDVVSAQQLCCVECGTPAAALATGRELEVIALEVQDL